MITNRMLLSQQNIDEEIPYKPFTDEEEIHWYMSDEDIQIIIGETSGSSHTISPIIGNQYNDRGVLYIPANHCTVEFGISNKEYEEISLNDISLEGLLQISPISYNEDGSEERADILDLNQLYTSQNEFNLIEHSRRVQIDFEDKDSKEFFFHLYSSPIIYNKNEGKCGYVNCYIKTSNAIHEQGPDLKEDGTPWIIKIAKLNSY